MKVLLAVPSYNRPYDIEKRTSFWLKKLEGIDWRVFVEPKEMIYYSQTIPESNIVETHNQNNLMGQIVDIYNYALNNGYDIVMKCDDDMMFKEKGVKKNEVHKTIEKHLPIIIEQFKKDSKLGSVNISKPMPYLYNKKYVFKNSMKPIYGNWITRTEILASLDKSLILFDDLYLSIETKLKGYDINVYYGCYEDAIGEKNEGGLQSLDRKSISVDSYKIAKKIYPKIKEWSNSKSKNFDIDVTEYLK
jgi:hypothetical protein